MLRKFLLLAMVLPFVVAPGFGQEIEPSNSPGSFFASAQSQTDTYQFSNEQRYSETGGLNYRQDQNGAGQKSRVDWLLPRSNTQFPLMKGLVEGRDVTLPLPIGIGAIWTEMHRTIVVDDIRLGLGDDPPTSAERIGVSETTFHASSFINRVDLWTLPFLNVYGIAGKTTTTGQVDITVNEFPLPGSPPQSMEIDVQLDGTTYGFGATAGVGSKYWFAMLDINKSWTDFTSLESELTALVIAPRFGGVIDRRYFKGEIHVGAMWQDTNQTVDLVINSPGLASPLRVQIDQSEPRPWNFLVGGLWAIDERVHLMVEFGMGGRSYIISGFIVRF